MGGFISLGLGPIGDVIALSGQFISQVGAWIGQFGRWLGGGSSTSTKFLSSEAGSSTTKMPEIANLGKRMMFAGAVLFGAGLVIGGPIGIGVAVIGGALFVGGYILTNYGISKGAF